MCWFPRLSPIGTQYIYLSLSFSLSLSLSFSLSLSPSPSLSPSLPSLYPSISLALKPGVIPYLPYSRHCKMRKRGCITAKLIAAMMCKAGMHQLITLDLRHKETQGFFDFTVDNLRGAPFLLAHIREKVWGLGRETTEGLHSMSKLKTCKCVCTYVCLCVWFQISDYRNGVVVARSPAVTRRYIHMSSSPFTALCISLSLSHTHYTHTLTHAQGECVCGAVEAGFGSDSWRVKGRGAGGGGRRRRWKEFSSSSLSHSEHQLHHTRE